MPASRGLRFGRSRGVLQPPPPPMVLLLLALISRPGITSSLRAPAVDDGCINSGVVAVHLVPKNINENENTDPDRLFQWRCTRGKEPESPCRIELLNHTRMRILCAGIYFVYSQLAYKMNISTSMVGHNTVVFRPGLNGAGVELNKMRVLMSAVVTPASGKCQVNSACGCFQTSYHGGVFFLAKDEQVAVMPFDGYMSTTDFCIGQNEMFLGAWLIKA